MTAPLVNIRNREMLTQLNAMFGRQERRSDCRKTK